MENLIETIDDARDAARTLFPLGARITLVA